MTRKEKLLPAAKRAVGLALASIVLAGCRPEQPSGGPVEWKFALEEISGSVQDAYAQEFRRRVEKRSGGTIRVTVYPYGALGTSDQLTELVGNGAIQFAMASPGHLGKVIPETQLFLLHFVFSEEDGVNQAVLRRSGRLHAELAPFYRRKGFELLSIYPEGWQVWTTRKPVREPADFAGMKIRVMTSPLLLEAYRAYGASPTPLPYAEVYSALQLRMIDGQVNPVFAIEEMRFYEVTDYLIFARHAQFVTTAITSARFFDGLPPERRRWVEETIGELEDYVFDVQNRLNDERLRSIRAKKPEIRTVELSEEERSRFREASLSVREEYVERVGESGKGLLDTLLREVRAAEARPAPTAFRRPLLVENAPSASAMPHPRAQSSTSG